MRHSSSAIIASQVLNIVSPGMLSLFTTLSYQKPVMAASLQDTLPMVTALRQQCAYLTSISEQYMLQPYMLYACRQCSVQTRLNTQHDLRAVTCLKSLRVKRISLSYNCFVLSLHAAKQPTVFRKQHACTITAAELSHIHQNYSADCA